MKQQQRSQSKNKGKKGRFDTKEDFMENILDVNISGPVSAYNFYIRDSAAANNLALIPASKKYGPQWSKMSENQKKKYEDLAE